MPLIPPETVDQINAANDIVEVVREYLPGLKRTGAVWKTNCPFHTERTPSFTVNPQRQIYKCFGCGAGGSAIRFVMNYESLDFVAATKKLAERAGIQIVETEMSREDQERYGMRKRLLALHLDAADFFHRLLMKVPSAQIARDYLKGRGISGEVAKAWKLGYAPDAWDEMAGFSQERGYSNRELVASGLVKLRDEDQPEGEFYDRFRGRVMFPICHENGEVIGFSGRVLEKDAQGAKYVNSPETMLFKKGDVLFGLHKSKRALIDKGSAIVCEGQLDLITAFEAGVQNVVAPQGTAFTPDQARRIKRYCEEVVLCFDADAAGQKAAERSLPALLAAGLAVRVATMPPGEDPDSLIRGKGVEAYAARIAAAKDFFDFQLDGLAAGPDFSTPRGRMLAARKLAESISRISDAVLRETVMNRVTMRLELSVAEFVKLLRQPNPISVRDELQMDASVEPVTLEPTMRLLALIALHDEDARHWILEEPWREFLVDEPDAELVVKLLDFPLRVGDPASSGTLLGTLTEGEAAVVSGLLVERPPEHAMLIAHDYWHALERRKIQRRIDAIKAKQKVHIQDFEVSTKLGEEILALQKRLSDIARPFSPPL
jgi:DNA primase